MKYFAFLRAINVGGNRTVPMKDLRDLFKSLDFENIKTFINSGNVIFESKEPDQKILEEKIESKLLKTFGFKVDTFIRSIDEIEHAISNFPYKEIEINKGTKVYAAFLKEELNEGQIKNLKSMDRRVEFYETLGREVYVLAYKDKGEVLFTNNLLEKKLGVVATTRDINTLNRVINLK